MDYKKIFARLFPSKIDIYNELEKVDDIDAIFENENLTYEMVINFIDEYKSEIIHSSLKDELLIDNLLCENHVIDRTQRNLINQQFFEELIDKLKNKEFNSKSISFYLYVMKFYNLYNSKYDDNTLKDILNTGIFSILNNVRLISEDGDTLVSNEKKIELTEKLLSWNEKCGTTILPYIFLLEELKNNTNILLSSQQAKQNAEYQNDLNILSRLCDRSIIIRDSGVMPNDEEVKQINNIFAYYEKINKSMILDTLNENDVLLVHFVRDNDVDYQLVGEEIMDVSGNDNNSFDNEQSDFFVKSYLQYILSIIESQIGRKFEISDPEIRQVVTAYLERYNNTINNRPLDRLPIKKRETSYNSKRYIRETDRRLSCSFISQKKPVSHLDRKIGLILRPRKTETILSTSVGYTCEKNFYDFRNDSIPCTQIFKQVNSGNSVNETCVDVNDCEVIGILLLGENEKVVERANRLAQTYNVSTVNLTKNMQSIK